MSKTKKTTVPEIKHDNNDNLLKQRMDRAAQAVYYIHTIIEMCQHEAGFGDVIKQILDDPQFKNIEMVKYMSLKFEQYNNDELKTHMGTLYTAINTPEIESAVNNIKKFLKKSKYNFIEYNTPKK